MHTKTKMLTPAAFAEQYIVESIWNGKYAAGTILPAERELAEIIGVTRTTLREVLQRLARDGWLTIQHGKPTQVNDIWQSATLNILDTLSHLDDTGSLTLADKLLEVRMSMAFIFLRSALKYEPQSVISLLEGLEELEDTADAFIDFDWTFYHGATRASRNPIYTLILNGFKSVYYRVGRYYFSNPEARKLAREFYHELRDIVPKGDLDAMIALLRQYGFASGEIWQLMRVRVNSLSEVGEH